MAGEFDNRQVRRFVWINPAGGAIGPAAGMTADELKIYQGVRAQRPDTAPIAQRGPVEFIAPSTSSEFLRLAVPEAASPFATPTGPRHDHVMVRRALQRSHSDVSKALNVALKNVPLGVTSEQAGQMRASLHREHTMLLRLQELQEWQDKIYGQIIGHQEA